MILHKLSSTFLLVSLSLLCTHPLSAQSISIHENNGDRKIVVEEGRKKLTIRSEGTFSLSEDDQRINSISSDGYLEVEEKRPGTARKLLIEPNGNQLSYRYREDGRTTEYDAEAQAWFANLLTTLVRKIGLGAESRVERFYSQSGTEGVLEEIDRLEGDHVQTIYFKLLLDYDIPPQNVDEIIQAVGSTINSDHYRTEIFKEHRQVLLADASNVDSYLSAISTVDSDHYKSELISLVVDLIMSSSDQNNLLALIATLDSDHYKHEVISQVVRQPVSEENLSFLVENLLPEIDSDHYRSEVIDELLEHQNDWSSAALDHIMEAVGQMDSDHYQAESLKKLLRTQPQASKNYDILYRALEEIDSDHYKSEVMHSLIKQDQVGPSLNSFLQGTQMMGSDHHRAGVLRSLVSETDLTPDQLAEVINSASDIKSDHYLSEFLLEACQESDDEKVTDAIAQTAKSISSDHYYGRVMKCLN
ncbi:MAG: hypothetical protein AAF992_25855 [Bacteroidota bacterium]